MAIRDFRESDFVSVFPVGQEVPSLLIGLILKMELTGNNIVKGLTTSSPSACISAKKKLRFIDITVQQLQHSPDANISS